MRVVILLLSCFVQTLNPRSKWTPFSVQLSAQLPEVQANLGGTLSSGKVPVIPGSHCVMWLQGLPSAFPSDSFLQLAFTKATPAPHRYLDSSSEWGKLGWFKQSCKLNLNPSKHFVSHLFRVLKDYLQCWFIWCAAAEPGSIRTVWCSFSHPDVYPLQGIEPKRHTSSSWSPSVAVSGPQCHVSLHPTSRMVVAPAVLLTLLQIPLLWLHSFPQTRSFR